MMLEMMKTLKKGWVVHYVLYRDFPLPDPLTLQCNPHDDDDDRGNNDGDDNVDGGNIDRFIWARLGFDFQ